MTFGEFNWIISSSSRDILLSDTHSWCQQVMLKFQAKELSKVGFSEDAEPQVLPQYM